MWLGFLGRGGDNNGEEAVLWVKVITSGLGFSYYWGR
jgi:hypothetical protein